MMTGTIRTAAIAVALAACCAAWAGPGHIHRGTPWSKLRTGMTGQQVGNLLGPCTAECSLSKGTWLQTWRVVDRCQGFGQVLYFSVRFEWRAGRWSAYKKSVSWLSEWWKGAGEYDSYDVSNEWP